MKPAPKPSKNQKIWKTIKETGKDEKVKIIRCEAAQKR